MTPTSQPSTTAAVAPTSQAPAVADQPGTDLEAPPARGLFRTDDPAGVVAEATSVAKALKEGVLGNPGMITSISDREHVTVEGWQTLGQMLGVTAVKGWVEELPWPVELDSKVANAQRAKGKTYGYRASYYARTLDGRTIGSAEAICARSEDTWMSRNDYALASMAQTRATSKALKSVLGFVVTLAGYSATPAEEMADQAAAVPTFGEAISTADGERARAALAFLLTDDEADPNTGLTLALEVSEKIRKDAGGYWPRIVGRALMHAAAALKASRGGAAGDAETPAGGDRDDGGTVEPVEATEPEKGRDGEPETVVDADVVDADGDPVDTEAGSYE